ncbi:MAG: PQQ-binding-like beta-propeller repeat protein [Planctomycetaceae bacterium]
MLLVGSWVSAAEWPGWRGPASNGLAADGAFPVEWSATDKVAWSVDLPGAAGSTPCVTGNHIFLTGPKEGHNAVFCFSRQGQLQWETFVGQDAGGKHKKGSGSNPSPLTDGEQVYVYYKSGDLAALDLKGKIVWQTNLQQRFGPNDLWWDLGSSPVLTSKHLVVTVMQTENSYLAAFDPRSGELVWKIDRNLGAPEEAAQSYSTPVVCTHDGQEQLVVVGADHVTCHSTADGHELWRVGGLNPEQNKFFRSIAGPVVSDGIVIAPYARGDSVTGIRLGGTGDVTQSHVLWQLHDAGSDVPTPAAANGRFYICRDKAAQVVCRDVKTGDVIWTQQLAKNRNAFSASPILAGGHLYCTREDGVTFVLDAESGSLVGENRLAEEFTVATPVFVEGQILIRTFERLYCIGPAS